MIVILKFAVSNQKLPRLGVRLGVADEVGTDVVGITDAFHTDVKEKLSGLREPTVSERSWPRLLRVDR